jgi:hypothetical protein
MLEVLSPLRSFSFLAAALMNGRTHFVKVTDSAGVLGQIRNSILCPQRVKWHKHA